MKSSLNKYFIPDISDIILEYKGPRFKIHSFEDSTVDKITTRGIKINGEYRGGSEFHEIKEGVINKEEIQSINYGICNGGFVSFKNLSQFPELNKFDFSEKQTITKENPHEFWKIINSPGMGLDLTADWNGIELSVFTEMSENYTGCVYIVSIDGYIDNYILDNKTSLQIGDCGTKCLMINNKHLLVMNLGDVSSVVYIEDTL